MYFGKNLRYLRKLKELSQESIADKLGYKSFTTIQKWESGDSEPPINKVRSICMIFNIPIEPMLNCDLEDEQSEILNRIKELLWYQNYNSQVLTNFLDIADISYKEWVNNESKTYMFYLSEISDFFGISVETLIGKSKSFWALDGELIEIPEQNKNIEQNINTISENHYNDSEYEMIDKYRILDEYGQNVVNAVLDIEYERCQVIDLEQISEDDAEYNVIPIPIYEDKASAGFGDEFLAESCRIINVIGNRTTIRADFALQVDGHSMEPLYYDGDIVLVHQQPAVDIGEIGIYSVDNKAFIKKQGEDRLISVNEDYDDIEPTEYQQYKCFGKVIGKLEDDWIVEG